MVKTHFKKLNKLQEATKAISVANTLINLADSIKTITTTITSNTSTSLQSSGIDTQMCSTAVADIPKPGRPKGTTIKNEIDLKRQIELASEEAAERFSHERKRLGILELNKVYLQKSLKNVNPKMEFPRITPSNLGAFNPEQREETLVVVLLGVRFQC